MIFPVPSSFSSSALVNSAAYSKMYQQSVEDSESFWSEYGLCVNWIKPYSQIKDVNWELPDIHIRWFYDGTLNVAANCLDRHLPHLAGQPAVIWESDNQEESSIISYQDLYERVCRLANAMKFLGVRKGERVVIYLPMLPETVVAMLACSRIGAIHSVVFSGFSADSLASRIQDCRAMLLITADEGLRGGRTIPLKLNVDLALECCSSVRSVIVVSRTGSTVPMLDGRDHWYNDIVATQPAFCLAEEMGAEDPLFILYTSGSTGKPKGILHTNGGYIVYTCLTYKYVFDHHKEDIYWCTADLGWITGHSYVVYGPLANGATTLIFEGVPNYPSPSRIWDIVDRYGVTTLYTSPTVIRSLMREGEALVKKSSRKSLRLLGSVGEPINPEAWLWYYNIVGGARCPIVDTWWQTETGGILLTPLPGATPLKPGSAAKPFFGIKPVLVGDNGQISEKNTSDGYLCIKDAWPGMMRTIFADHKRFIQNYFSIYPGLYFTGDGARRDSDGYYWITGRVDDVINVSGHRLCTTEVEHALSSHPKVVESAVVGYQHDIKGQCVYAYVMLITSETGSDSLKKELSDWVRKKIGPIATPDIIQWVQALPKTRSGKVMRRILRNIASREESQLGDISTLAEPEVVKHLIENRP